MTQRTRNASVALAVLVFAGFFVWLLRTAPPTVTLANGSYTTPVQAGSRVALDISSGGIEIIAGDSPELRIDYIGDADRQPQVRVKSGDRKINVSVQDMPNRTRMVITVPKQTALQVGMGAGELSIRDIVGDKDVTVYAGRVQISGEVSQYGRAEAKVLAGKISLAPMHVEKGGVFRFASAKSTGKYGLDLTVLSGEIFVSE